jgi:MFS family permease
VQGGGLSNPATEASGLTIEEHVPRRRVVITALGAMQILAWGSSYYLLAVLAKPIADDTGWALAWIVGGLSLGLLVEGLVSPYVGDAIERYGGRPILAISAGFLCAGLLGLALAPNLPLYIAAWLVVGVGMGAGLYDAAFSTLGRLYGRDARQAITALTLFGGFASTVCWPLSAFLTSELGWRGACLAYAGIQLAVALPVYLLALPREAGRAEIHATNKSPSAIGTELPPAYPRSRKRLFVLIATVFTLASVIASVMSVHLLTLLQARDVTLAAAVALGALIGPSQVGARVIEMLFGRHHHPIWTMMASAILVAAGVGVLWADLPLVAIALVFYGGGMGIKSIARGTLPLAVFGAMGYPSLMGRLAMPSLIAGAASPSLGVLLIESLGASGTLAALTAAALVNVGLVVTLLTLLRRKQSYSS